MNPVREHFDSNTSLYIDEYAEPYRKLCLQRLEMLAACLAERGLTRFSMLDVGCGAGVFADMVLAKYPQATVVCVDFSAPMLARNTRSSRKYPLQADARQLPFRPSGFDVINIDAVMHHLIDFNGYTQTVAGIGAFLSILASLLKPKGILAVREIYHEYVMRETFGSRAMYFVSTKRLPGPVAAAIKAMGLNTANAGVCFLTRKQWRTRFAEAGYRPLAEKEIRWSHIPFQLMGFRNSGDFLLLLEA
jgi:SAM-dependent methyltransferase